MRARPSVDMKVINVGVRNTTPGRWGHSSLTALDTGELGPAANGKMLEASLGRAEGRQDGNIINQDWTGQQEAALSLLGSDTGDS